MPTWMISSTIPDRSFDGKFFPIFFVCWLLLGIGSAIFLRSATYEIKKRWYPRFTIAAGVVFLGFIALSGAGPFLVIAVPAVTLITYLNIRSTRFCPKCGKTLYQQGWSRPNFCSKCGANLDGKENTADFETPNASHF